MRTCESLRADVTYIPMRRGFLHLVAMMDWASRNFLAWRLSNTMDDDFCVAALKEAMAATASDTVRVAFIIGRLGRRH
jgi:hypothetical protein